MRSRKTGQQGYTNESMQIDTALINNNKNLVLFPTSII